MAERTIYILLTRSGTWFSRLIHLATQDDYTHASIGLDGPRGPFYSFARKYERLALPAGLVEEQVTPHRRRVPCCLYALTVDEETYLRLSLRLRGPWPATSTSPSGGGITTSAPSSWPACWRTAAPWTCPSPPPCCAPPTSAGWTACALSTRGLWRASWSRRARQISP